MFVLLTLFNFSILVYTFGFPNPFVIKLAQFTILANQIFYLFTMCNFICVD